MLIKYHLTDDNTLTITIVNNQIVLDSLVTINNQMAFTFSDKSVNNSNQVN
jgi:hypothetical protein